MRHRNGYRGPVRGGMVKEREAHTASVLLPKQAGSASAFVRDCVFLKNDVHAVAAVQQRPAAAAVEIDPHRGVVSGDCIDQPAGLEWTLTRSPCLSFFQCGAGVAWRGASAVPSLVFLAIVTPRACYPLSRDGGVGPSIPNVRERR